MLLDLLCTRRLGVIHMGERSIRHAIVIEPIGNEHGLLAQWVNDKLIRNILGKAQARLEANVLALHKRTAHSGAPGIGLGIRREEQCGIEGIKRCRSGTEQLPYAL